MILWQNLRATFNKPENRGHTKLQFASTKLCRNLEYLWVFFALKTCSLVSTRRQLQCRCKPQFSMTLPPKCIPDENWTMFFRGPKVSKNHLKIEHFLKMSFRWRKFWHPWLKLRDNGYRYDFSAPSSPFFYQKKKNSVWRSLEAKKCHP